MALGSGGARRREKRDANLGGGRGQIVNVVEFQLKLPGGKLFPNPLLGPENFWHN